MITFATATDYVASITEMDPKVNRVLDVATFKFEVRNPDGTRDTIWELNKPVGKFPRGKRLTLRQLHRALFGV